jgi:hypothetical protein
MGLMRGIRVEFLASTRNVSLFLHVQTHFGVHSACYLAGTTHAFPIKKPGSDADHSPHLVSKLKMCGAMPLQNYGFLDFVHRPVFLKLEKTTFRKPDVFPSSGEE